ncbi:MAG: glycosyltransferase family 4 protein [Candidatus Omnitrophota bacterium]
MKRVVTAIDHMLFFFCSAISAVVLSAVFLVTLVRRRRATGSDRPKRLSFAVYDLTSEAYPCLRQEALLDNYFSEEHSLYIDFERPSDESGRIDTGIFNYRIVAHPARGLYAAGFKKTQALLTEWKALLTACAIVRKRGIDVVRAHDPHFLGMNGILVARLFGIPSILHMNSDFDEKYRGTGRTATPAIFVSRSSERFFERLIMRFYDRITADREYYRTSKSFPKDCIGKYRAFGVRVHEAHYAEKNGRKNMKEQLGVGGRDVLLYVGRLHSVKYPRDAIEALRFLKEKRPKSALIMVGEGAMRSELEEQVRRYRLQNDVVFLGSRKPDELVDIYHTSDVVIAPHGGVTLVEAALASKPVVAYDFDWHAEFLRNGEMGFMVPFGDVWGLAEAVSTLLNDRLMRERFGARAREIAETNNSRRASLDREKGIYRELLRTG